MAGLTGKWWLVKYYDVNRPIIANWSDVTSSTCVNYSETVEPMESPLFDSIKLSDAVKIFLNRTIPLRLLFNYFRSSDTNVRDAP